MSFRVNVDPTNPGQFFACCGLLELADRLWPGAEGWFADGRFQVATEGSLQRLLIILVMDPPVELVQLSNGLSVPSLIAPLCFTFDGGATTALTLDTWMTIGIAKGEVVPVANPPWNFWSGQQTSKGIWTSLRSILAAQLRTSDLSDESIFAQRRLLSGRFGFDPGPAWNALDVGFSLNEQKIEVESSPVVELLAAVGVQRFRPQVSPDRTTFQYATWGQPLAPSVAFAASSGKMLVGPAARYRGSVVSRGNYAALGYSIPLAGDNNE